jgi:hypothetical protein
MKRGGLSAASMPPTENPGRASTPFVLVTGNPHNLLLAQEMPHYNTPSSGIIRAMEKPGDAVTPPARTT